MRFMKVSAREEYGLRCLLQLAGLGEGEFLTLAQIAGREGISQANAGKVMWLLNKAGLVSSKAMVRLLRLRSESTDSPANRLAVLGRGRVRGWRDDDERPDRAP